jgi:hypothetical protein
MNKRIETGTRPDAPAAAGFGPGVGSKQGQKQMATRSVGPKGSGGANPSGVSGSGSVKTYSNKGGLSHPTGQPGSSGVSRAASKKQR